MMSSEAAFMEHHQGILTKQLRLALKGFLIRDDALHQLSDMEGNHLLGQLQLRKVPSAQVPQNRRS